ncbi:MAG: alpha/beta fold hydrolase [Prevotella sp.]|nr:alpha/beta fold hydrolase [Prevotella sp.]
MSRRNHLCRILGMAVALMMSVTCHAFSGFVEDTTIVYTSCDSIQLAATLALPEGGHQRYPAVVLMSGTGQQDRNCTMAGHVVFKEISDYLVSRGIAVLRTDDRGMGKSTGNYSYATTADFAADALAAVAYLKTRPDIDTLHIGLLGHSEGGASISIAASQSQDVAFLISLCGLMTAGLPSVIQQNIDIVESSPIPEADKKHYHEINERLFRMAYKYADSDSLEQKLYAVHDEWRRDTTNQHIRYGIYMYAMTATSPWYRFFIRYNPADYLSKVNVPVLLVFGGKDIMVNARQNEDSARRCLAHNKDVEVHVFPQINHLLLSCEKGTQEEYASLKDEHVLPELLSLLGSWIHQHLK